MTRPPDPGQPHYRPPGARVPGPPGRPGGQPYGPPPQPPDPGPASYQAERRGLVARLLDTSFDDLITPSVIRAAYRLALIVTTLWTLLVLLIGLWLFQYGWLLTIMAFIAAPLIWLTTMLATRIFLEAIVVHFKGVEYLRVMKDKDTAR